MSVIERPIIAAPAEVTAADVLTRAADLIEEFGWCQHDLGSKDRPGFCMLGAFIEANRDFGRGDFAGISHAATLVSSVMPEDGWIGAFPITWNNAPGRTKAEVVAKLREAAEVAR